MAGGERRQIDYDWERWWFPRSTNPPVDTDGVLLDPAGPYGTAISPNARRLEALHGVSCLGLLGEPGIGKSHELNRYIENLRARGEQAEQLNLGDTSSEAVLGERLDRATACLSDSPGDLTLVLDGLDEATLAISRVVEFLCFKFDQLDRSRVRLRVASRSAGWPDRFEQSLSTLWPEGFSVYSLGPLTPADIAKAEKTKLGTEGLLESARSRGAGMLTSRPVTLNLLMAISEQDGGLPETRRELYDVATRVLLTESDPRRRLDQTAVPVTASRPVAAEAAALAVLGGRAALTRWLDTNLDSVVLESDLTLHDGDAIAAVWNSGLVRHRGENRAEWVHRSVAEFLAAEALAELPFPSLRRMIADPDMTDRIATHLMGVATWMSFGDSDVFDWLLASEPESLLTEDLGRRAEPQRARIGAALLESLEAGIAPGWVHYGGLTYAALDE